MAEKELPEETQQDVMKLQNLQRQLQMLMSQKQRYELEITQADTALAELQKAKGKAYKSIGTILIEAKPAEIKKEVEDKRNNMNERIETLKSQEEKIRAKGKELQERVEKAIR